MQVTVKLFSTKSVYGNGRRHETNQQVLLVYTADLFNEFTGMDFDTVVYLSVKPRLLMKNVDLSANNRQRLKVSY